MKPMAVFFLVACLLSGCKNSNQDLERALALRQKMLSATSCQFETEVTADYGDKLFSFSAMCNVDSGGELTFSIISPESIQDISGTISDSGGKLTFEDAALNFPLLSEEELSPVSAPWIFMKTLRSGYLTSVGQDADLLRVSADDSYQEGAMKLDIWINEADQPVQADILHNGSRILSLRIRNFQIL